MSSGSWLLLSDENQGIDKMSLSDNQVQKVAGGFGRVAGVALMHHMLC